MQYNEHMKEIRLKNKKSQRWIAEKMMIQQQQYNEYEVGKHEINIRYLKMFCEILNCSADEILEIGKYKAGAESAPAGTDIPL